MPPRVRSCARCNNKLTKKRLDFLDEVSPNRRVSYCVPCSQANTRERKATAHDRRVVDTYGLRPGEYIKLYDYQGGKCAICRRAIGKSRRLAVDHDHAIGSVREAVRGLLCSTCNKMVGHSRDDPAFFLRAYNYLIDPPARKVLK